MNGWIVLGLCALSWMVGVVFGMIAAVRAAREVYGGKPHEVRPDLYPQGSWQRDQMQKAYGDEEP